MAKLSLVKPTHKAIQQYYAALRSYREHHVTHEGALETAFGRLLEETAKPHNWKLIPKQKLKVGKLTIYPDGTLRDPFNMRYGFWEAKDTEDDLDAEIQKKIAKGYPLNNTIFEDTRQAVPFQGGNERYRFDLADPKQLAALLNEFYAYTEPEIDSFHQAVEEFKTRVPELAASLVQILADAHKKSGKFQDAFDAFFALCQTALNQNISRAAVDEMLVQHLLTERLFRKIFDNPEFTRRNVIAVELEKVIDALVSLSFNRDNFLRSLDRFYRAIEEAASPFSPGTWTSGQAIGRLNSTAETRRSFARRPHHGRTEKQHSVTGYKKCSASSQTPARQSSGATASPSCRPSLTGLLT